MSWLDESYTEVDAARNELKNVQHTIVPKWYDTIPPSDEGVEGEVRYVYSQGKPLLCVKMNSDWHFTTMQTVGSNGAYLSDSGELSGTVFDEPIGFTPSYDSGWRHMIGADPGDESGWFDSGLDTMNGLPHWFYAGYAGGGPTFHCLGSRALDIVIPGTGEVLITIYLPVYLLNHGLGFTRPPSNVQLWLCSTPPHTGWNTDPGYEAKANCLQDPPMLNEIESIVQSYIDMTEPTQTDTDIRMANLNQNFTSYSSNTHVFEMLQFQNSAAFAIISPNHIVFSPNINATMSAYVDDDGNVTSTGGGGFFTEWGRFYIWR